MGKYIISNASVIDGKLEVHPVIKADSREDAIEKAQENIAEDFGYSSWEEYLSKMDPEIKEKDGISYLHSIYGCNCGHEEMYRIEEAREQKVIEEPEKCRWIAYDCRTMCPEKHDINNPYWRIPVARKNVLKYCPYCGKEIDYSAIDDKLGGQDEEI